jgi:hypothetical protein
MLQYEGLSVNLDRKGGGGRGKEAEGGREKTY